jgi:methylated-DNA-[protein]-cysteine S-methyltransferase
MTATTSHATVTRQSPIGPLTLTAVDGRLVSLRMDDRDGSPATPSHDDAAVREAADQLDAYFAGSLTDFDLPLALAGTEFEQRVWALLREIGYGETVSYGEIARWVGSPGSARAVGVANARNPIAIIVPCHRVIGADGSMTGYGGGLGRKVWLLEHEASHRERRGSQRGASPSGQLALGVAGAGERAGR